MSNHTNKLSKFSGQTVSQRFSTIYLFLFEIDSLEGHGEITFLKFNLLPLHNMGSGIHLKEIFSALARRIYHSKIQALATWGFAKNSQFIGTPIPCDDDRAPKMLSYAVMECSRTQIYLKSYRQNPHKCSFQKKLLFTHSPKYSKLASHILTDHLNVNYTLFFPTNFPYVIGKMDTRSKCVNRKKSGSTSDIYRVSYFVLIGGYTNGCSFRSWMASIADRWRLRKTRIQCSRVCRQRVEIQVNI